MNEQNVILYNKSECRHDVMQGKTMRRAVVIVNTSVTELLLLLKIKKRESVSPLFLTMIISMEDILNRIEQLSVLRLHHLLI